MYEKYFDSSPCPWIKFQWLYLFDTHYTYHVINIVIMAFWFFEKSIKVKSKKVLIPT